MSTENVILLSPKSKVALQGSVNKWRKIVLAFETLEDVEENGTVDCPLCRLYHPNIMHTPFNQGCDAMCPIKQDTGLNFCKGSPYQEWEQSRDWGEGDQIQAEAMLTYLEGLQDRSITLTGLPK